MNKRTEKPPVPSKMLARAHMVHGYRELLGPHMIIVLGTISLAVALTFALVGTTGFFHVENRLERVVFGLLYTFVCWPSFYALKVATFYFLRFRRPIEILAALAFTMLLGSFQCSAVIHAIETLTHPGYPAAAGFLQVYLLVAISSLAMSSLGFYIVWQRVRHPAPVTEIADTGREMPAAARGGSEATEASGAGNGASAATAATTGADGNGTTRQPPSGSRDTSPASAVADSRTRPLASSPAAELALPAPPQQSASPLSDQPAALLTRVPNRLGSDLVYIKSEDHYLEVHTTVGSSLVKMRFSDAVAELGDRGIQVHRSYWVATQHVTRAVRSGRRTVLRLTGDHKVPVSGTHLRAVRAALRR